MLRILLIISTCTTPLLAQSHIEFPLQGDLTSLLNDRLSQIRSLKELNPLMSQLQKFDPKLVQKLKDTPLSPHTRDLLRQLGEKFDQGRLRPQDVERIKKQLEELVPMVPPATPPMPNSPPQPIQPPTNTGRLPDILEDAKPKRNSEKLRDRMEEWLMHWFENELDENWINALRDSPTLRSLAEDFARAMQDGSKRDTNPFEAFDRLDAPDWLDRVGLWGESWQLPEGMHVESPSGLGDLLDAPPESLAGYLLVGLALALLTWMFLNSLQALQFARKQKADTDNWGVVAVQPDQLRTVKDLLQAFAYLARQNVGSHSRYMNHRTIALELSNVLKAQPAVESFSQHYEKARYALVGEELPPAELESARASLRILMEKTL